MAAYGTIRKQIAKLTGEIPELADLDRYMNDLKSSVHLAAKEVVRTVKVPDDSVVAEVRSLRRERIELEEAREEQRKKSEKEYKEVQEAHLRYTRSLRFGLFMTETMLPNIVEKLAFEPASQAALMEPHERLFVDLGLAVIGMYFHSDATLEEVRGLWLPLPRRDRPGGENSRLYIES